MDDDAGRDSSNVSLMQWKEYVEFSIERRRKNAGAKTLTGYLPPKAPAPTIPRDFEANLGPTARNGVALVTAPVSRLLRLDRVFTLRAGPPTSSAWSKSPNRIASVPESVAASSGRLLRTCLSQSETRSNTSMKLTTILAALWLGQSAVAADFASSYCTSQGVLPLPTVSVKVSVTATITLRVTETQIFVTVTRVTSMTVVSTVLAKRQRDDALTTRLMERDVRATTTALNLLATPICFVNLVVAGLLFGGAVTSGCSCLYGPASSTTVTVVGATTVKTSLATMIVSIYLVIVFNLILILNFILVINLDLIISHFIPNFLFGLIFHFIFIFYFSFHSIFYFNLYVNFNFYLTHLINLIFIFLVNYLVNFIFNLINLSFNLIYDFLFLFNSNINFVIHFTIHLLINFIFDLVLIFNLIFIVNFLFIFDIILVFKQLGILIIHKLLHHCTHN
ncbi:hypothetical protein GQ53DRAFT_827116 [Thozetella sp. PMI_491]|nr:hypothetical protein GQ53DRAFT_827116 [Thozetella sp. PMI_491]